MSATSGLNLRPQERRVLVVIVTVLLLVLNALFIWPHFKDWRKQQDTLAKARKTLLAYQQEVTQLPQYQARLQQLEGMGSGVLPADQALQLMRIVQNQAQEKNVAITSIRYVPSGAVANTNTYFDEQAVSISINTGEEELVNFLVALGSGDSMIRVRDMDLHPDPPQYKLNGTITLVASYQKNAPPRPASTPARRGPHPAPPTKKRP